MNRAKINILWCSALLCCTILTAHGGDTSKDKPPVPDAISGIYPSMSISDFVKIRPQAKPDAMTETKIDVTKPRHLLYERINRGLYNYLAIYSFHDKRLDEIQLAGVYSGSQTDNKKQEFIRQVIQLYGAPTSIKVAQVYETDVVNEPELLWVKPTYKAAALYSTDPNFSKKHVIQLIIASKENNIYFDEPDISISEKDKIIKDAEEEIKKIAN